MRNDFEDLCCPYPSIQAHDQITIPEDVRDAFMLGRVGDNPGAREVLPASCFIVAHRSAVAAIRLECTCGERLPTNSAEDPWLEPWG
jgi:hypothetical protein